MKASKTQAGFTIVELLISTAVFSTILLLCATAIIQVGRIFYKGVTVNRTQDAARRVVEDISQSVQFGANTGDKSFSRSATTNYTSPNVTVQALCLGEIRYNYTTTASLGTASGQVRHVLWKDRVGSTAACNTVDLRTSQPSPDGVEILGGNMRLPRFNASLSASNLWDINVTVAYGDTDDLFEKNTDGTTNYGQCVGSNVGGQFCAVSSISTSVAKRL